METIAVYWEPKIRVYGLTSQVGSSLYTVVFPLNRLSFWAEIVRRLGQTGEEFLLVNLQTASATSMLLCLVTAAGPGDGEISRAFDKGLENEEATTLQIVQSVELIYLHGPHFQDRYGIAEAAARPLRLADIPILSFGCAGTSVFIVVPEKRAIEATACLSETFVL